MVQINLQHANGSGIILSSNYAHLKQQNVQASLSKCSILSTDREYHDAYELQRDLRERKVKGALLDGYMAGSYNELFEEKHIRVKEIIDFNNGYGIVLGGIHHRLRRCFKNYVKRKRSFIVDYVASQIQVVKVNDFCFGL